MTSRLREEDLDSDSRILWGNLRLVAAEEVWTPRTTSSDVAVTTKIKSNSTCLINYDNIRLENQHDIEGDIDHPEAGTQRLTSSHQSPRQPVSDTDNLDLPGDGLREGVAPVMVGGHNGGGVALDLERQATVHNQPLCSSNTEVRMNEDHPHHYCLCTLYY